MVLKARPSFSGPLRYAQEPRRGRARPGVACGAGGFRQVLWCAQYQGACTRASPVRALTPPSLMALPFCAESGEPWQIWEYFLMNCVSKPPLSSEIAYRMPS